MPYAPPLVTSVSVIVPTRDRPDHLARALASIAAQHRPVSEVIVVDDGSTRPVDPILDRTAIGDRVTVVRHAEPRGAAAARNTGLDVARGDVIAFLDDDDEWMPAKVARQVDVLEGDPDVGLVGGQAIVVSGEREILSRSVDRCTFDDLLWFNVVGSTSFAMWHRHRLPVEPRFDPTMEANQDWHVWLQAAAQSGIAIVAEPVCRYHDDSDLERISRSDQRRAAARTDLLEHWAHEMTPTCRTFHSLKQQLETPRPFVREAGSLARAAGGSPRAALLVLGSALAGRLGDRVGDPGRGGRALLRMTRVLDRR